MRVECANCHKVYDIPDERLPVGEEIAFPCQACKEVIKIDLRSKSAQVGTPSSQTNQKEQQMTSAAADGEWCGPALHHALTMNTLHVPTLLMKPRLHSLGSGR